MRQLTQNPRHRGRRSRDIDNWFILKYVLLNPRALIKQIFVGCGIRTVVFSKRSNKRISGSDLCHKIHGLPGATQVMLAVLAKERHFIIIEVEYFRLYPIQ